MQRSLLGVWVVAGLCAISTGRLTAQSRVAYPPLYQQQQLPELPDSTLDSVGRQQTSLRDGLQLRLTIGNISGVSVNIVEWFNNRRLLEPLGYVRPAEFEALYYQQAKVA